MKRQLAVIIWKDAAIYGSDQKTLEEAEECELIDGIAAGLVVKETRDIITLAMDSFHDFTQFRNIHVYPKSGIKQIIRKNQEAENE